MLDWPGKIATTVFVGGCNFRCPYCQNADLVLRPDDYENIDPLDLVHYLNSRKLWVEHVVITGGEPTIHKGLEQFLVLLKSSGFKVKLDTNGSRPNVLRRLISSGLVDFVAMDFKGPLRKYPEIVRSPVDIEAIEESARMLAQADKVETEFRLTFAPELLTVEDVVEAGKFLRSLGAKKMIIQQFQNKSVLEEEFLKKDPYPVSVLEDAKARLSNILEVEVRGV